MLFYWIVFEMQAIALMKSKNKEHEVVLQLNGNNTLYNVSQMIEYTPQTLTVHQLINDWMIPREEARNKAEQTKTIMSYFYVEWDH